MKCNGGFTLIELVIVLILLSILSVGVYFQWNPQKINLGAEAERLANTLRYTQSLSMTKNQRYRFVRNSSNTYQITNSSGTPILNPQGNATVTLYSGITFGTFTNLPNNLVAFDSNGIPYVDTGSPGTALSATAIITLTASGITKSVLIAPQTGKVTIS